MQAAALRSSYDAGDGRLDFAVAREKLGGILRPGFSHGQVGSKTSHVAAAGGVKRKDAAAGGVKRPRKCGPCTTRLGTPVLLIDCGGDRNGHSGSSARGSLTLQAKAEPALQLPVQEMPQVLKVPAGERPLSEPAGKMPMAVPVGQMPIQERPQVMAVPVGEMPMAVPVGQMSIQGRPQVLAVPVGEMPMAVPAGQMPIEGWPQVLAAPVKWWPL